MSWNLDKIGAWTDWRDFEVTAERTIAYAEATNDEHPKHLSGELAPPVFGVVPVFEVMMPTIGEVVPGEVLMRVVHGEQDMRFHAPMLPGQTVRSRGAVVGVHGRSSGVAVVIKGETVSADGDPVVDQYMTAFIRGAELDAREGEEPPPHEAERGAELASVQMGYDDDQTQRYSKASGDPMPIHLDDDFAKAMGLPGIIVHGLCTMAFTSRAVIQTACPDDPTRLKRLALRFSSIVQPHETVTTTLWEAGEDIAFETRTDSDKVAIKDGLAHVD